MCMFMTELKTIKYLFYDDFKDVLWLEKMKIGLEISEKQELFGNAFVHGFDNNFQLVNYFGTEFEALDS